MPWRQFSQRSPGLRERLSVIPTDHLNVSEAAGAQLMRDKCRSRARQDVRSDTQDGVGGAGAAVDEAWSGHDAHDDDRRVQCLGWQAGISEHDIRG
jgi:hypothetical protein